MAGIKKYGNKKVKNTKKTEIDGIVFRSKLEGECYQALKDAGINSSYEPEKISLLEGFYPNDNLQIYLPVMQKGRVTGWGRNTKKIRDITYTPDFVFKHKGYKIYIEVKGFPNDNYPNIRKMFLNKINKQAEEEKIIFFEPRSKSHINLIINILQSL